MAVIEWDLNFCVVDWNPAAVEVFGFSRAEALGQHATFILPDDITRQDMDILWETLLAKRGGIQVTNWNLTRDGRTIPCEWYNTPLVDEQGKVVGVASLALDITERKQVEDDLINSQTELAQSILELESVNHYLEKQSVLAKHLAEEAELANRAKSDFWPTGAMK